MSEYEQITSYLDKTSQILVAWFEKILPELSKNWWNDKVFAKLSYNQQERVRYKKISSLSGLDLAALLRVFDQNWDELSLKNQLLYEDRHFLKEMQKNRNRWAHKPIDGYEQDYVFRDLDTIQRFVSLIAADDVLITQIKEAKAGFMAPAKNDTIKITGESKTSVAPSQNAMIKAKNLAIRVPWQDNGWAGFICSNPGKNTSCIRLKRIAEEKNTEFECLLAKKNICELSLDELKKIPCFIENSAFLSEKEFSFSAVYPFSTFSGLNHIKSTVVNVSPYTLMSRPYRWLRTKDTPAINIISGYNKKREEEFKASHKDKYNKPIKETWVNEPLNQKAVIEYYYDGVSEKSLLVPYLKNVPFTDDDRRIVLGVGYAKKVHENQNYDSNDKSITPIIWDKIIEHDLLDSGLLLPYKELYDYWVINNQPDIDNYILFADSDYRSEFSNGSEPVSYDALLSILNRAKEILLEISKNIPSIAIDYSGKTGWINIQIERLIKERGIFPAIGNLFLASDYFAINHENGEKNIALDILKAVSFDGTNASIELLKNIIENELQLTSKQKEKAKLFISDNLKLINNLSRFTLTEEQFRSILTNKIEYSPDNPYLLYENSFLMEDKLKISLNKIDNGMFFNVESQKTIDNLIILDTDSKERLRAFIIRELDEQSQNNNGHSLLSLNYLIELIQKRNLFHKLNFDKNDLNLPSYKEYIEEKIFIKEINGEIYFKLRTLEELDEISRNEIIARLNSAKLPVDTEVFDGLLTSTLPAPEKNDTEEIKKDKEEAKKEKFTALKQLSTNKISVLIGGAGTGKTTTLAVLCKHPDIENQVQLLAPTGKARVRMWDATGKKYKNTNTIAGFLFDDGCFDWKTGRYKPPAKSKMELTGYNVIIDESSMLTTEMFAAVLKSCSQAKRIIFTGDPNQLPPIGCGKPFSDLVDYLQKEHPDNVAQLTCVMRTDASETNDFAAWFKSSSGADETVFDKVESNKDPLKGIRFRQYADNLQEILLDEIVKITGMKNKDDIKGFDKSLGARINDPHTNFNTGNVPSFGTPKDQGAGSKAESWQILSPVKNSPDGTYGINDLIHLKYRPTSFNYGKEINAYHSEVKGLQKIGVGDKVICTKNGKSDPFPPNDFNYITNGEIGIRVYGKFNPYTKKHFQNVEFSTQLNVSYWGIKFANKGMEDWKYMGEDYDGNLELAYAITIHKAQGSQFKNVILVLNKNSGMLSRELIYTAITRQREGLVILFNDDISQLIKHSSDLYSVLAKRCTDLFNPPKFIKLKNGWYEEAKIHRTNNGVMVRSKSEVIIANDLENAGLDWHYENDGKFIEIAGRKLLPDFVIQHSGKTYYWEHLGLLNNAKYERNWAEKEKCYLSNKDIILKTSKDKQNGAIDSIEVVKIINEIKSGA